MEKPLWYLQKMRTTPLPVLARRLLSKTGQLARIRARQWRDAVLDTRRSYAEAGRPLQPLPLSQEALDLSGIGRAQAGELLRMWRAHRFDLLGSGWVEAGFLDNAPGLCGRRYPGLVLRPDAEGAFLKKILQKRNVNAAVQIWKMIEGPYQPIDWQKDVKSGYRWSAKQWYHPQELAKEPGGDIKAPWELSRLQHLPRMAVWAMLFPGRRTEIVREIRNQTLDFIAQNPPRMGVNYMCAMDVGIRTANLALAYSILACQGVVFDSAFERVFSNAVFQSCHHIYTNLEWSEVLTSNHYFADIAGLLYGAAILPDCSRKEKWYRFAQREIKREIQKQFHPEGTNREGSTAYHRLTGEMALYSAILIDRKAKEGLGEPVSPEIRGILYGAARFSKAVTRPDGRLTQIGDNDSGMFFRLSPTGALLTPERAIRRYRNLEGYIPQADDALYADECPNDCRPFVSAAAGYLAAAQWDAERALYPLEYSLAAALAGERGRAAVQSVPLRLGARPENLAYRNQHAIPAPRGVRDRLSLDAFPQFGLYILRSEQLYLCLSGADNGQNGNGGHAHNDKLSIELFLGGRPVIEDPGTFVYTALPEERNRFRGVGMHATGNAGEEQNRLSGLFSMKDETRCVLVEASAHSVSLALAYRGIRQLRQVRVLEDSIEITDWTDRPMQFVFQSTARTDGYGKYLCD